MDTSCFVCLCVCVFTRVCNSVFVFTFTFTCVVCLCVQNHKRMRKLYEKQLIFFTEWLVKILNRFYQNRSSYLNCCQCHRHRPCSSPILDHFVQPNDVDGHSNSDLQCASADRDGAIACCCCAAAGRTWFLGFSSFPVLHDRGVPATKQIIRNQWKCYQVIAIMTFDQLQQQEASVQLSNASRPFYGCPKNATQTIFFS